MKERNLDNIEFHRNWNYIPKEKLNRVVLGFDSETYKGKVTLLTDSLGNYVIPNSFIEIMDFFKINIEIYKKSLNFFFNLEYDTNAILKHLEDNNLLELISVGKTIYEGYEISYLKQKYLKIVNPKLKFRIMFFDIAHFYQVGSLVKTYYKTFGKLYKKRILERENGFNYSDINDNVIKYCIEDSQKCKELAENFVTLCDSFIYVKDFFSPASLSKALMRKELKNHSFSFNKNQVQQFALLSYQGGRFETFKKGFFDKIFVYDINSAYPSVFRDLPLPRGLIVTNDKYLENSIYSYFQCDLKLYNEDIISPLKYFLNKKNLLIYPMGKIEDIYLTKKEYEFLSDYEDIEIKIKKAKHIVNKNPIYPFKFFEDLYNKRMVLKKKKDKKEFILKIASNSAYGISIQLNKRIILKNDWTLEEEENPENELIIYNEKVYLKTFKWIAGQFFNPIFATEITSRTRIKLLEDSYDYQKNVLMYATDSIISDKRIDSLKISDELGDYKLENKFSLKGVILGNGIYQFQDGYERKKGFRGFSTSLNLYELLKSNGNSKVVNIMKYKPFKLKESRTHLETLNEFAYFPKDLDINCDNKRIWDRNFEDCNDVLNSQIDSKPIILN